ncbi:MAG: CPBP family intramembrane metalloprotease [Planctomycetaceae bacterium]|nr:CPBP family intramembrane metalloprotease [Planctomycetaceae bacterium]
MFHNETTHSPLPVTSALFLLPFLVVFELGMIAYSSPDIFPIWGEVFIPGMFSCILLLILLVQQICYTPKQNAVNRNEIPRQSLSHLWKQSCLFGFTPALLIVTLGLIASTFSAQTTGNFQLANQSLQSLPSLTVIKDHAAIENWGHRIFVAVRSGLLEEFFFRVLLFTGLMGLLLGLKMTYRSSLMISVVLSSGLFAFAHDTSLLTDFASTVKPESLGLFLYRFSAGSYLALICQYRGFGVAAGAHIFYNLAIGCCL